MRAWLFAIARNRCRTVLAARRDLAVPLVLPDPGAGDLAEDVQRREDVRQLIADVAGLPDDQRAALVLSELGDLPHIEIAREDRMRAGEGEGARVPGARGADRRPRRAPHPL